MSTTALSSLPLDVGAIPAQDLDAEYARRWAARQVRGRTHDRAVRRRLINAAPAAGATTAGVGMALLLAS